MIAASRFLIVEDELLIAETISDFLKGEGCTNIYIAESVDEAIDILTTTKINFVLTDIALGEKQTGIELGNLLNLKYRIPFIYVTSHADRAMIDKAKHTRPSAYIVKPFKKEDLLVAIELGLYNAIHASLQKDEDELVVKDGRALVKIYMSAILWLETEGNYTTIYLKGGERRVIRIPLSELEDQLSVRYFMRIHKSCIINKKHVIEVKSNSVVIDGNELSAGRTYQSNLANIFS